MTRCGFARPIRCRDTLNGYDLTGARIWFQFHAEANGPMPQILYFNGRRVAMGDDLEPVVLFDKAKPGDKVTVAVKLLHTVDTKSFRGATLRIEFPESRPNPEDLRLGVLVGGDSGSFACARRRRADGHARLTRSTALDLKRPATRTTRLSSMPA